nr:immunoglobulin heavy chain junction region [Macaca mulatta]MOV38181.1 immunoglobulin heavy chain junction region [Macaca mulatta]MOV38449.1 immunoglobulin heavy chain junction region [Macaca mulatta]MOV38895.1 immunoglobulin heavy chain junction region [Macaca mulatta]MOV38960.1 immunoglobulin heavy chain junction region [Macaca mulatta]
CASGDYGNSLDVW